MEFLLHKIINQKKYVMIIFICISFISFLFGLYYYQRCIPRIRNIFTNIFIVNGNQNQYTYYLLSNIIYIFINTYFSSNYNGFLGILFMLFIKGITIAFSLIYIFSNFSISVNMVLLIIIELLVEIVLMIVSVIPNLILSVQTLLITFYIESNYNYKNIFNYKLNILILSLIIFIIGLLIRIYLINIIF